MALARFLSALSLALAASAATAQTGAPAELAAWTDWVQAAKPERNCPVAATDDNLRLCHFPAQLQLNTSASGASFSQLGERYSTGLVELVGSAEHWPQNVTVNSSPAVVLSHNGKPALNLPAGRYLIQGQLQWATIPSQLALPAETGLIEFTHDGQASAPRIENQQLLLGSDERASTDADQVSYRVYRLLEDAVPQRLTTVLDIDVGGGDRTVQTGALLLPGFAPIALSSDLPAKLNDDGSASIQLRPGRYQLQLVARATAELNQFAPPAAAENWPAQELWSVSEDLSLRQLQFGGATQVDPKQTELPERWRQWPAFIVGQNQPLELQTLQQGRDQRAANLDLHLTRTLWLDFDGEGFTASDHISGQFAEPARLIAQADYQLGSASINNKPQVITHLPNSEALGVAVPAGHQLLVASGRSDHWRQFNASGWQHGFASASAELKLPPGWQLLHAQGVDSVSNSWLARWDLWGIFLVVIVAAASWQLLGAGGAVLSALAFVLSFHSQPLLAYIALICLLAIAITKALPTNRFRQWFAVISAISALVFTLNCLPFFVDQLRTAFYPQLAEPLYHEPPQELVGSSAPMEMAVSAADEVLEGAAAPAPRAAKMNSAKPAPAKRQLDTSLERLGNAQTGPALPQWQWDSAELTWSGPITAEQQVTLWALPPWASMIWRIVSVLLVGSFLGLLLTQLASVWRNSRPSNTNASPASPASATASLVAPVLLALLASQPTPVQAADLPSEALLQELSKRLDAEAQQACPASQCASIESVQIAIAGDELSVTLRVHSARTTALPLPAKASQWLPRTIAVNDQASSAFKQDESGLLWLALPAGSAEVRLTGPITSASLALPFAMGAPNISLQLPDNWQVQGLRDGRLNGSELQLSRAAEASDSGSALTQTQVFPGFAIVERELELRSEWILTTTVIRVAPETGVIRLALPLWHGESVLSGDIEVRDGRAQAVLAPDQHSVSWQSRLTPVAELELSAPENAAYAERWSVVSDAIWQVDYQGINPLNQAGDALRWQPRAGDKVSLSISSPVAAQGPTHTVDSVSLVYRPGARAADSELNLQVRASAGGLLPLTLPAGAELLQLAIDGREQQLSLRDGKLNLPLTPGEHHYQLRLRHDQPQSLITRTPVVDAATQLNNITLRVEPAADRWILAVTGPLLGPAITYWGVLLVIVAAALLLGRWSWLPFGVATWLVLGVGMSTVNAVGSLWVVAWFFAMRWRAEQDTRLFSTGKLQWLQIGLALLTLIAGWQLLSTIPVSLLSQPDMMIGGYHSSSAELNWYQDHAAHLPVAEVLSLPLWVYRALMLAWSLWLALILLQFARFGWQAYSAGELWRAQPPKAKPQPKARAQAPATAAPANPTAPANPLEEPRV